MIHLGLILYLVCYEFTTLIFLYFNFQLSQHHWLKTLTCLGNLVKKSVDWKCEGYLWTLNSIPLIYMSILKPLPYHLNHCSIKFWNWEIPQLSSFWRLFWSSWVFIWILRFVSSYKEASWDYDSIAMILLLTMRATPFLQRNSCPHNGHLH